MPHLPIPLAHRPGLEILARLPDGETQALQDDLRRREPILIRGDVAPFLQPGTPGVSPSDLESVITALLGAGTARARSAVGTERFAGDVAQSRDLDLSETERGVLATRLQQLLDTPALATTAKGLDLQTEYERTFHSARVVTDIRPLFTDATPPQAYAAAIDHTLKIQYHGIDGLGEIYLALDEQDLKELQAALDRARGKAGVLAGVIDRSGLKLLRPEQSE